MLHGVHAAVLVFAHCFSLGSCDCEAMAPKKKSEDPADVSAWSIGRFV